MLRQPLTSGIAAELTLPAAQCLCLYQAKHTSPRTGTAYDDIFTLPLLLRRFASIDPEHPVNGRATEGNRCPAREPDEKQQQSLPAEGRATSCERRVQQDRRETDESPPHEGVGRANRAKTAEQARRA